MLVSDRFIKLAGYLFFFIFGGLAIIMIFILEHGLTEAWLALNDKNFTMAQFTIVSGISFLVAGIAGILMETVPSMIRERRRLALSKKYADRYK